MSIIDDFLTDSDDIVIGLDYEGLHKMTMEEFAYQYCKIENQIPNTMETKELQDRILNVYNKEMIRRIKDRLMHPDDFEKACEQAYLKLEEERMK